MGILFFVFFIFIAFYGVVGSIIATLSNGVMATSKDTEKSSNMIAEARHREVRERAYLVLKAVDKDNDGTISMEEMETAIQEMGELDALLREMGLTTKDVKDIYPMLDFDADGRIDYDELVQ